MWLERGEPGGQQPEVRHKRDTGAYSSGLARSASLGEPSRQSLRRGAPGVAQRTGLRSCSSNRADGEGLAGTCQAGWMPILEGVFVLEDDGHRFSFSRGLPELSNK